jgi:hypothetical protein
MFLDAVLDVHQGRREGLKMIGREKRKRLILLILGYTKGMMTHLT